MKRFIPFLLLSLIIFCFAEKKSRQCRKGYAANEKLLVIISFDGLRKDYINSTTTPYLAKLRDKGARTEFTTLKFPNALNVHQTMSTGYYPKIHGVFAQEWFELKEKDIPRKLQTYERAQYENKDAINNNVIPIWTLNEIYGGTSACMMWPGCEFDYGPEKIHPTFRHDFDAKKNYETRLNELVTWMNESATFNPPNLVMIYFHQPDYFAHIYGPNSPKIIPKLKELDEFTKNFTDKLKALPFTRLNKKLFPSVNIVFVSDHRVTEILYQDILDIKGQGICNDVKFWGTDVWLQQAWTSRENDADPDKRINGDWQCCDNVNNCHSSYCWKRVFPYSKCIHSMCDINIPPSLKISEPDHDPFNEFSKKLANFTIFVADVNYTWSLQLDEEPQKLVFAAYGEKLFPKIENWRKEYNFKINECTTFGVHGYNRPSKGYFMAIGPEFVKNLDSNSFNSTDLYSLFAAVLGLQGDKYNKNGSFNYVKHLLVNRSEQSGSGLVKWIQHLKLIIICSVIHCAVFYIAVEIFLSRRRNGNT